MTPKAVDFIKSEIAPYLGIPYFINSPQNQNQDSPAKVGKGTAQEIAQLTIDTASQHHFDIINSTPKQIYQFQKKHSIGLDCSGLAYHLLDSLSQFLHQKSIYHQLVGTEGKQGPRRLSAHLLTSPPNAHQISLDQIQTGDLIRLDQGKHVLFIINQDGSKINYVHSSHKTKTRGVHLGQITITHPQKDLNHQLWSDTTLDGKNYNSIYNPKNGDGIFRLNLFS